MQISRIYSNKGEIFTPIDFHCDKNANILNVVFAEIKHPKDRAKDSHNVGKTTLIHIMDFVLLKQISSTDHFLEKHKDRFDDFVFYGEIALYAGDFVTIRRPIENNRRIWFKRHEERGQDFTGENEDGWDHEDVAIGRAVELLDAYLDLRTLRPWDYRKGISYFLRSQDDYRDILQVQKFLRGKDADWKPFAAHLFGLDHKAIHRKYELDTSIEEEQRRKKERQAEVQIDEQDLAKLANQIEIRSAEIEAISQRLDEFSFDQEERRIARELVENIGVQITDVTNALYNLNADIARIERSITKGFKFKIEKVKSVFEEAQVTLPEQLVKSYEDLVDFNKKLCSERNKALRRGAKELKAERDALIADHQSLDARRRECLKIIRDADAFTKYKAFQRELSNQRADLTYLQNQYDKLQLVAHISTQISKLERERSQKIDEISANLRKRSTIQKRVALVFNEFVKRVLDLDGHFYASSTQQVEIGFGSGGADGNHGVRNGLVGLG